MRLHTPLILAAASLAVLSSAQTALTANNTVTVPSPTFSYNILAQKTDTFTGLNEFGAAVFSGSLTSYVLRATATSPLSFGFVLTNTAGSLDPIEKLSLSGYAPFTTAVLQGIVSVSGTQASTTASRTGSGVVGFNFISGNGGNGFLSPGSTSQLLIIDTNAQFYTNGAASIINGGVGTAATYMPVPEPSAFAALGLGALGLLRRRARKA